MRIPRKIERSFCGFLIAGVLLLATLIFIRFSSPILLGIDRVTFFRKVVHGPLSALPTIAIQFSYFLWFYLFASKYKSQKFIAYTFIGLYLLMTVFILGQKFSAFIIYATFAVAVFAAYNKQPNFGKKHWLIIAGSFFSLFLIVAVTYQYILSYDLNFIFYRIALQSQLLWCVLEEPFNTLIIKSNFNCYLGCGFESGQDFITAQFLPDALYQFYKDGGTVLSGFMPALSIYTTGFLGAAAISVVFATLIGACQAIFFRLARAGNAIGSFLMFKVCFALFMADLVAANTVYTGLGVVWLILSLWMTVSVGLSAGT